VGTCGAGRAETWVAAMRDDGTRRWQGRCGGAVAVVGTGDAAAPMWWAPAMRCRKVTTGDAAAQGGRR